MTRITAKRITLTILDRWGAVPTLGRNVRFVVLKNRFPQPGRQDAGHIFTSRNEALVFAESRYRGDYALLALTESGSVDLTPA